MDWWRAANPKAPWSDHELYLMLSGLSTIMWLRGHPGDIEGFKRQHADFGRRWEAAIATCRSKPDRRLVEILQPEGLYAEALSRASASGEIGK